MLNIQRDYRNYIVICHSKPYIDMNTELRKAANNDFEKDLFKLMLNCVIWIRILL